jgi:hypothetical protein
MIVRAIQNLRQEVFSYVVPRVSRETVICHYVSQFRTRILSKMLEWQQIKEPIKINNATIALQEIIDR